MIGYLSSINASQSISVLREELEVHQSFTEASVKKYEGLLERKWTSNARLQKKVRYAQYTSSQLEYIRELFELYKEPKINS